MALDLALALDAHRGVREGVEPSHRDLLRTDLADPVLTGLHPHKRVLDVGELAALDLGQLRADLVLGGVEGGIDDVPRRLPVQFPEERKVACQGAAQGVTTADENRPKVHKCVFTSHDDDAPRPPGSRGKALPITVAPNSTGPIGECSTSGLRQPLYRKNGRKGS